MGFEIPLSFKLWARDLPELAQPAAEAALDLALLDDHFDMWVTATCLATLWALEDGDRVLLISAQLRGAGMQQAVLPRAGPRFKCRRAENQLCDLGQMTYPL